MSATIALSRRRIERSLIDLLRALNEVSFVEREVFERIAVLRQSVEEVSAAMDRQPAWVLCVAERVEEKVRGTAGTGTQQECAAPAEVPTRKVK